MARGRYGHMIKSLIVIGDFFCLNIAYAVVCYWGGGFDGGFGVKIIWLLLNLSYFPVFSLFAKIHELLSNAYQILKALARQSDFNRKDCI